MDCWGISSKIHLMLICLIPLGHYPCFIIRPSYVHTTKPKLSLINNPCDKHVHNSLSNVAVHMACVNMQCAGHYHDFTCALLSLLAMGNTLHGSDCIYNKEVYVANSHLISNTWTVSSTWQNFRVKIFLWGTDENLFAQTFNTWIFFHTRKFPNLWYKPYNFADLTDQLPWSFITDEWLDVKGMCKFKEWCTYFIW